MSQPFVGEIRMFAGNFAPSGWAFCDGSLLSIAENEVLFILIGTTYGGDGQQTFQLPDLRSRVPIHQGSNGAGNYVIGQAAGIERVALTAAQTSHSHILLGADNGTSSDPGGNIFAGATSLNQFTASSASGVMNPKAVGLSCGFDGTTQPHENRMPYQAINFIISLFGIFPSQS